MKILLINETITVLVNHIECLFELLDLGLVEHSKDVGSRPLGTLLRRLPLGTLGGRHFG